jgi:hypothetical protein
MATRERRADETENESEWDREVKYVIVLCVGMREIANKQFLSSLIYKGQDQCQTGCTRLSAAE